MTIEELQVLIDECPFHRILQIEVIFVDAQAGQVSLKLPFRKEFSRSSESVSFHGGIIASLIDIAGDYAVAARIGRGVPTIDLRIDYLRPAGTMALVATAKVLKVGRSIGVVDVEVRDDDRLVAVGRASYGTAG